MKHNRKTVINFLQQEIRTALSDTLKPSNKFALVDYPNYSNVGDAAIWLGTIKYFEGERRLYPDYVCTMMDYVEGDLKEAVPTGTIFIQGGGNFGDLWPSHQNFREQLVRDFPDHKIVQLPQSIHFKNAESMARTAKIINAHRDFTLIVRDHKSLRIAQENFTCKIKLAPDMAFFLGPLSRSGLPQHPLLFLHRTDNENAYSDADFRQEVDTPVFQADWLDEPLGLDLEIKKEVIYELPLTLKMNMFKRFRRRELWYRRLAEKRLRRGIKLLSIADFIITDRLHAHIISLLLDIPHVAMDNNYGKIHNFIDAWTKDYEALSIASNWPDAMNVFKKIDTPVSTANK